MLTKSLPPDEGQRVGVRLFSLFRRDFIAVFGQEPCFNCPKFHSQFDNYIQTTKTMAEKKGKNSGYVLKTMFNGVPCEGVKGLVSNVNLDDTLAKKLIKNHPLGEGLFAKLPEGKADAGDSGEEKTERQKELEALTVPELKAHADSIEASTEGNKAAIVKAILEKEGS